MNREDIIRMGHEAGLCDASGEDDNSIYILQYLERFAKLVAKAEREECAKMCDEMERKAEGTDCCKWPTPVDCAFVIRARGKP